jgi:hypothetical protein
MLEAARVLGVISAVLLVASIGAWVRLLRGPALQRLDGRVGPNFAQAQLASQLLMLAAGLSAVAAILAVAGWTVT